MSEYSVSGHSLCTKCTHFGTARRFVSGAQETFMAKGMNRGNREPKKPKAKKPAAGPAASLLSSKGMSPQPALPKKKD